MRLTFKLKLIALIAIAASSSLIVLWIGVALSGRVQSQLTLIGERYVPQIELGPQLEQQFSLLQRAFQDAAAASDEDALAATHEPKARLLDHLAAARGSLDPEVSAQLRGLIESYHAVAYDVSKRMIAGEAGEDALLAMQRMQERQSRVKEFLKQRMAFDKGKLVEAFRVALDAQRTADSIRLLVSVAGIFLVGLLSFWIGSGTLRTVAALTAGFERFGRGEFDEPIRVTSRDELDQVAARANQMADNLRRLAREREVTDWLKEGVAGLSDELRGELGVDEVAKRTLRFCAERVGSLVATVYLHDAGELRLAHELAVDQRALARTPEGGMRMGSGLLGHAALSSEITVVSDVPAGYLRVHSGLGHSDPRQLVFVPFRRLEKTAGILELAFFAPVSERELSFLGSVQETVSMALEAAFSRRETHTLLDETRTQATQLEQQEEELRRNNHELLTQQEELRSANEDLEAHRNILSQQNSELERARQGLQQKAEELAKASAYKSQFLANMSHELRTPLNSMLLLSDLMAKNESGNLSAKQVEHCQTIHGAGRDLLALINQILDLAKIEAGRQEVYLEDVSVAELARRVRHVFAPLAAEKGLVLAVEIGESAPESINTDQSRVERILTNLLGNAIKFTQQGTITLRIDRASADQSADDRVLRAEDTLAFSVTDTGIGIPAPALERVFAPFEQLESRTDRRYGGTGLGLAISRESARLLGGILSVQSTVDVGSTFTCYLPLNTSAATHKPSPSQGATPRMVADDRDALPHGQAHLLVVEDDIVLAEQLVEIIRTRGLGAVVASTGAEAVQLIRERKPQGIILDVRLPDTDGFSLMTQLRNDPATRGIPVHFVSAVDAPERGLSLGAVGYLVKPVSRSDLLGMVRVLAPWSAERPSRILVVEDSVVAADSIVRLLGEQGLESLHVGSAKSALEALCAERFHCMVLDLGLPDMDGLGLLESLSATPSIHKPPVVVYTARALTREETRRLHHYVEAVVLKEGNSEQRLLEELRLFVGHVKEALPHGARSVMPPSSSDVKLVGQKLLIVDDDMRTAYSLSALLHGRGAEVLVADNGREALDLLAQHQDVAAVLMDVMMPEMDGYDATRRLRSEPRLAQLPVIALTAKALAGERERCLEAGASDYLTKPVDGDELLLLLRKWLDGRGHER